MWFKKRAPVVCAVCGKVIDPRERRFVEKNRTTKTEQHTHVNCSSEQKRKGDCSSEHPR